MPAFSLALGAIVFIAFALGGNAGNGAIAAGVFVVVAGVFRFATRSETLQGLGGPGRDERWAMIDVHAALVERQGSGTKGNARMILTVHDELLFEVRREEAEEVAALVRDRMQNAVALQVKADSGNKIQATAAETGASVQNIQQLVNDEYQVAFALFDSATDAAEGKGFYPET